MKATFVHDGNAIDYRPAADTPSGSVVVQGELVGVTNRPLAANELGALAVVGVFDLPKATGGGTAIGVGAVVYWDEGNQQATTDSAAGANKQLGKAVAAAADEDETVRVRLSQ